VGDSSDDVLRPLRDEMGADMISNQGGWASSRDAEYCRMPLKEKSVIVVGSIEGNTGRRLKTGIERSCV
jgi:hypothetical protein